MGFFSINFSLYNAININSIQLLIQLKTKLPKVAPRKQSTHSRESLHFLIQIKSFSH